MPTKADQEWIDTLRRWLPVTFKSLAAHAIQLAAGERGVLFVEITTEQMRAMLPKPGRTVNARLDPAWHPAEEFFANLRTSPSSIDAATVDRWQAQVAAMNPRREVALFLARTPDADGHWMSRFIVTRDGNVTIH